MTGGTTTPQTFHKILLTRLRFIGDVVLTTPIIRAVRSAYPQAHIAYLAEREALSLLDHNPNLNETIPYDFRRNVLSKLLLYRRLRMKSFDLVIDLFGNPRSALLTYFTGARVRVGLDGKPRSRLYTHRILDDGQPKTAVEFYSQFLHALEIDAPTAKTEVFLTEDERREARIYLRWQGIDPNRPIVGLHPGASWPAKVWSADRFAELADRLIAKLGAQVLLTEGPKDHEAVVAVSRRCVGSVKTLGILPLRQLAALLSHVDVYVANDSGPMHIAVAVGTKTIGIFGPGEENIWFPYDRREGHLALRKDVWCHPCHLDFCDKVGDGYMKCMQLLEVDEVFNAVEERLRWPS
jgi:predicted lipopolysaccharide heptosyltransferase III